MSVPELTVNAPVKSLVVLFNTSVPGLLAATPCVKLPVPLIFPSRDKVTRGFAEISAPLPELMVIGLARSTTELGSAVDEIVVLALRIMLPVLAAPLVLKFTLPEVIVSG